MATITARKSIFDMDNEEFEKLVKPVALKAKQDALDSGAWFSYQNDLCTEPDMFIHEFKDGRKELIKLGNQTGEYTILKVF
jgi:hypothetical protein